MGRTTGRNVGEATLTVNFFLYCADDLFSSSLKIKTAKMKELLFAMTLLCLASTELFSQANAAAKEDSAPPQKLYLPARFYSDSLGFEKEMPALAARVLAGYKEKKRRAYFEDASAYYLLTGDYRKAADFIDSVQNIDDDISYGIDFKSYARAKMAGGKNFEDDFRKEFAAQFTPLSFRKKVYLAFLDSTTVNGFRSEYWSLKDKLKKTNADSLSMDDAKSLADKYSLYKIYNEIFPLMSPLLNAPEYRESFPAIRGYKWAGVVPVKGIDELPDPTLQYKLLMELTSFASKGQDSAAKKRINPGLGEVARLINLHEANGIAKKNMNVVVVVHASALNALLTNEKYKKKYGLNNPNLDLIKELQRYGAKIVVCGQAMTFFRLEKEDLAPGIKQALTAQTVLSTYQLKNYVYYDLSLRQ